VRPALRRHEHRCGCCCCWRRSVWRIAAPPASPTWCIPAKHTCIHSISSQLTVQACRWACFCNKARHHCCYAVLQQGYQLLVCCPDCVAAGFRCPPSSLNDPLVISTCKKA
jgi:hypothetical protein